MGTTGAAQQLAQRIETAREGAGLSVLQLSAESGIPSSTLHRKLRVAPDLLTIGDVSALALVLGAEFDALFVRTP